VIPKFQTYQADAPANLLCPSCNGDHLHHTTMEIFERNEDAINGLHVTVKDGKVNVDTSLADNPSSRRHGLKVTFWCETCHASPVLVIAQHKGCTDIDFA
jgi:hypothetical protein